MTALLLFSFLVLLTPPPCFGALNIGTDAAEDLVSQLRQSIFVETAYLSERREERCSSLDGPRCFEFMAGSGTMRTGSLSDGPGVLPERLLHDLGLQSSDVQFYTPDFNSLESIRMQLEVSAKKAPSGSTLTRPADAGELRNARNASEQGTLHFTDLTPDGRVPLSFSRGLPNHVVATWDGRWLIRDCDRLKARGVVDGATATTSGPLALPAPQERSTSSPADPYAPVFSQWDTNHIANEGNRDVSVVAEITGSLGYLRFSQPVIIRSLFARWAPVPGAPPALIGGRLGLDTVWTTHLDPSKLSRTPGWMDVSGGPLEPVDEIAFLATQGLEIGALEVSAREDGQSDDEEQTVLMLVPMTVQETDAEGLEESSRTQFQLKVKRLSPAAAPYVVSLQEVISRNLKLNTEKPTSVVPRSELELKDQVAEVVAKTNIEMFEHRLLAQMAGIPVLPADAAKSVGSAGALVLKGEFLANVFKDASSQSSLPSDLRKELVHERAAIVEALTGWLGEGKEGWHKSTPSSFPRHGTDTSIDKYMTAKRWQSKLDLLTASFLHVASSKVAAQAEQALQQAAEQIFQQQQALFQAMVQQQAMSPQQAMSLQQAFFSGQ